LGIADQPTAIRHAHHFFYVDLLHHFDFEIPFCQQLLQPGILLLELA